MSVIVTEADIEQGMAAVESARKEFRRCLKAYGDGDARTSAARLILAERARNQLDLRQHLEAARAGREIKH